MFKPVSLYIGLRYTRAKRRNHFISFISLVSMLGIALGVSVLITVLSVMNGFDHEIRDRIFSMAQHVTISNLSGQVANWESLSEQAGKFPEVVATAPFIGGQALVVNAGMAKPIILNGILPRNEMKVSQMESKFVEGSFRNLHPGEFGILLGQDLAASLGLGKGDKVTVMTTDASITPFGILPQSKRFTVAGIFHVEGGFHMDETTAYIHLNDAQKLFKLNHDVTGIRLKVSDLYAAPKVTDLLQNALPNFFVSNWTQGPNLSFFKAIKMEKTSMFIILLLIIIVAVFNLVSSLVMVVTDKRSEIAILRTLGASPRMILSIFMVQGCIVGIVGTLLGTMGGILLALNATEIVAGLQRLLNMEFISSSVYFIDYLPSRLEWKDVLEISGLAFLMSVVATLYPAWQASRTQPAEALRYE